MTKTIVLIDSTPGGLAIIPAVKRMGHSAVILCSERFEPFYRSEGARRLLAMADQVVSISDSLNFDEVRTAVSKIVTETTIDAIICPFEYTVPVGAQIAAEIGVPFTNIDAVSNARIKDRCRRVVETAGVPAVRCESVTSYAEAARAAQDIGFPVIVKPSSGAGSMAVRVVYDATGLHNYFSTIDKIVGDMPMDFEREGLGQQFLVEQFIEGLAVSVEIGRTKKGTIVPFMLSERAGERMNPVLTLGTLMPAALDGAIHEACIAQATDIVRALKLDIGIFHIEMIISDDGPRLIEVNPRIMGGNMGALYGLVTDCDIFELLVRIHLGEEVSHLVGQPRRYGSSMILAPAEDGVIKRLPTQEQLAEIKAGAEIVNINAQPGQVVRAYSHGFGALGAVLTTATDAQGALDQGRNLVNKLSNILGVSFL